MSRRRVALLSLAALAALAACCVAYAIATRRAPPVAKEARIFVGGDVHFGAHEPKLGEVAALVSSSYGIVNLEGPTTKGDASRSDAARLVNAAAGLPALARDGIRVVGIANNHARDIGPDGSTTTAAHAREAGLVPAGGAAGPAIFETPVGRVVVTAHELGAVPTDDVRREIEDARRSGALLIATFHVTGPPSYLPRPELRAAVDVAIAAGARVVAAHGTHAIAAIERRRDAVIAWGLGNLLFSCDCTREREGAVLEITLAEDGAVHAALVPILAGLDGEAARLDPDPKLAFDLLEALGSSPFERRGPRAVF